jgi:putative transposase
VEEKTMPRRARLTLRAVPMHLIQRGNNRQACFFADEDYRLYLDWLKEYSVKTGCRIHAFVLMTNHVHLLVSAMRIPHQTGHGFQTKLDSDSTAI